MSSFESVLKYDSATVTIYFPEGRGCCQFCPLLETYSRNQCRRTGEYIADTRGRGMFCPLEWREDDGNMETRS